MWFKDLNEHADLIKPAAEIRPFLEKHYEKLGRPINTSAISDAALLLCYDNKTSYSRC